MQRQGVLDLGGGDVLAARDVDVLDAVDDRGTPRRRPGATRSPVRSHFAPHRAAVAASSSRYPAKTLGPLHPQLPGRLAVQRQSRGSGSTTRTETCGYGRPTAPAWSAASSRRQVQHVRRGLGQPVPLGERHPVRRPCLLQRDRDRRAADQSEPQRRHVGRQPSRGRRRAARTASARPSSRSPDARDQLQDARGLERALQHDGRADPPRQQRLAVPAPRRGTAGASPAPRRPA